MCVCVWGGGVGGVDAVLKGKGRFENRGWLEGRVECLRS